MTTVLLAGCQSTPLASYLKAVGVLRLVAEQTDPDARGRWTPVGFEIDSSLDPDALVEFLTREYVPTPIVAPWNGGSGFFSGDKQSGIKPIETSSDARFAPYREVIAACRAALDATGLDTAPEEEAKAVFLAQLRATLPDVALPWMDAAVVLTDGRPSFPPLLATGGNDGRLEFSNNQMQRLAELLLKPAPRIRRLARASLFGNISPDLERAKIGQFSPMAAGGANAGAGFGRGSLINPWDYVLLIEGSLLFAAAATRRDEVAARGTMSFPFSVRASAAGYGTAATNDPSSSHNEMWLPLWDHFAAPIALRRLFGEGRAKVGRRAARSAVDFARAACSLGVDRGITSFERVGFHKRNGKSYFAIPLGPWPVTRRRNVGLLDPIDSWLLSVRRAADAKHVPGSLVRAAARLDDAVLEICRRDSVASVADLVVALGEIEAVASRSPKAREALRRPIPPLAPTWLESADDRSVELRLAAALAASGVRRHLAAVNPARPTQWDVDTVEQVWGSCDLVRNLGEVLQRRDHAADRGVTYPQPRTFAALADVAAVVRGDVDDARLEHLLRGLCLLDSSVAWPALAPAAERAVPPAAFAMLRCALDARSADTGRPILTPGLTHRALAGDLWGATRIAERRLRGTGTPLRCGPQIAPAGEARRIAAALAFPLSSRDQARLHALITRPRSEEKTIHD